MSRQRRRSSVTRAFPAARRGLAPRAGQSPLRVFHPPRPGQRQGNRRARAPPLGGAAQSPARRVRGGRRIGATWRTSRRRVASTEGTIVAARSTAYGARSGDGRPHCCQFPSPRSAAVTAGGVCPACHSQRTRSPLSAVHRHTARTEGLRHRVRRRSVQALCRGNARVEAAQLAAAPEHEALAEADVHLHEPPRARAAACAGRRRAARPSAVEGSKALEALHRRVSIVRHHALRLCISDETHRPGISRREPWAQTLWSET